MSLANVACKLKFAYLDKLHDQLWFDTIIDIYQDMDGIFIEFADTCVRVPNGWQPPCDIVVGDVAKAYYVTRDRFVFELQD